MSGREVMFSSNVTPELDLRKAGEMGAYINLDDVTHVDFLERVAGIPDTVCCRYNPGGSFSLGNTIMDMPRDAKYGMTEDQMAGAFLRLARKGAKHFGIHALLASNAMSNEYYPELAAQLFRLAVRLQRATGVHIAFVNLSGGVGWTTGRSSRPVTSAPSARGCGGSTSPFWRRPVWRMWRFLRNWAGTCWRLMAI